MGKKVRKEQARWNQTVPTASFEMLWLLLKPGIDIYEHWEVDNAKEPFVVSRVEFNPMDNSWDDYMVHTWYLENDSTSIIPADSITRVSRFHGEKPIHEIALFPCGYWEHHIARKAELVKRAQMFVSLQQKKCMYFEGDSRDVPRQSVSVLWANTYYSDAFAVQRLGHGRSCAGARGQPRRRRRRGDYC